MALAGSMTMRCRAALAALGAWAVVSAGPGMAAAQAPPAGIGAALAGDWSSTGCGSTGDRLRFAGNTLTFFLDGRRSSEYEVGVAEADGQVIVSVVRVVHEPPGPGGLAPGATLHYRRQGDALRLVGIGLPGGGVASPTVATVYRRCK